MKVRRTLTGTVGLIGLYVAVASPALAAVDAAAQGASLTVAPAIALVSLRTDAGCSKPIAPALAPVPSLVKGRVTSKAAAILGAQVSQLEVIAQQQAAQQATKAPPSLAATPQPVTEATHPLPEVAQALPGEGIEPAAGGFACPTSGLAGLASTGLTATSFAASRFLPGSGHTPLGSNDFLASKRLPVGKTTFDAAWGRVQDSALPKAMVKRAIGRRDRALTRDRIAAINSWTNGAVRYVEDRELYGRADYWADASATLQQRAGDCEDIAIAKMQLLAAMGVPRSDMYLTIARDLARNADHAMLVVKFEGEHLLLDNATNALLDASYSYDYRPILSFNTAQTWLHGY